jgi:hypothetical protein
MAGAIASSREEHGVMPTGVEVTGYVTDRQQEVLPDEALAFLAELIDARS